ncbi:uncharacterized protein LOC124643941, partial [Helicoverpa zea]|uniref:uncharacterized protein LOC124643941 n=1 Tax=Helicoverpa zea TaxID=7113 RepID=UPI001F58A269
SLPYLPEPTPETSSDIETQSPEAPPPRTQSAPPSETLPLETPQTNDTNSSRAKKITADSKMGFTPKHLKLFASIETEELQGNVQILNSPHYSIISSEDSVCYAVPILHVTNFGAFI